MPVYALVGGPCDGDHVSVDARDKTINAFPRRPLGAVTSPEEGTTSETYQVVMYTRRTIGCNMSTMSPYPVYQDYFAPANMTDIDAIRLLLTNYKGPR